VASLRASIFPRDAVVALVAFGATLVLIGVGHGPTRSIDVVGLALAALANLSPSVTGVVIDRMARQRHAAGAADERLEELTPREREVLELFARGLSNGEIASALVIEESTVKTHVKRILMKLGLRDRVHAVILAYDTGIASAR